MGFSRDKGSDQFFAKLCPAEEGHELSETSKSKYFSSRVIQNNLTQGIKGLASKETVAPCGEGNENENLVSNKFLGSNLHLTNEGVTLETSAS